MAIIKKNTTVGKDVEKREPPYTVGENVNWYNYYGKKNMEIPQKIKNRTTIWSTYSTFVCLSDEYENTNPKRFMHP